MQVFSIQQQEFVMVTVNKTSLAMKAAALFIAAVLAACMGALACGAGTAHADTSSYNTVGIKVAQSYKQAQVMVDLINKERGKRGLSKVKLDKALTTAAIQRAAELAMYVPNSTPHMRPDGRNAHTVSSRVCYENCLEGETFITSSNSFPTAKFMLGMWMDSPSHKKGILLPGLKSIGIGCCYGGPGAGADYYDRAYWTLEMSKTSVKTVEKRTSMVNYTKKVKYKKSALKSSQVSAWINVYDNVPANCPVALTVYVKPSDGFGGYAKVSSFKWTSSDPSVAAVTETGKITLVAPGKVTLTGTLIGHTTVKTKVTFHVLPEDPDGVFASGKPPVAVK